MNMTRFFSILSISALALVALAFAADSARCQDDQGGGSFWSGGFGGGGGGRGGGRQRMQMQMQQGGEGDDGSGGGFGGGFGGRGGGRGRGGGFGGGGRGGRNGGWGGGGGFPGGGMGGGMDGGFDGGMDGGAGGQFGRGQGGASDAAGGTKPASANDGIPHFSEVVGVSPPPGFGGALAVSTVTTIGSTGSSSSGASASPSSSSATSSPAQIDEKTRSFAQAKMKQFDKNNNGQLEKEEWSAMNDGEKYDLNKDGIVSLDEMIQYLSRPLGGDDSVAPSPAPKAASASRTTGGRPGRFRSLAERYPDLSAKFFQLDRDGDGQIEMWEYSTNWTEQTVREFQKYDLNGDGIITPEEWLKVEPKGR